MMRKKLFFLTFFTLLITTVYAQNNRADVVLNGVNMVPDVQTGASGSATIWVESDTLYVKGEFSNLQSYYFASNIHYGGEGETGNPIYKLKPDISEDHTSGTFDPEKNKFKLSDAMLEAFNNRNLYITVASDDNRRGEIRGQINSY
ncbi:MAG: CHRD domain-containing protein [Bacteroidetes bacterium]|jgi:P pilus assembly chaperone PapD|nr:CHRD domain-containing protein [Bacteroidota bacterium]